jgi:Family of unknown function (DUF6459)
MSTTTLTRPPVPGGTGAGTRQAQGPGTAGTPRTSVANPWDRVRFAGPATAPGTRDQEDSGATVDDTLLPDPEQWAAALVRSAVEALCGIRPAAQLARWLSAELYESLARRAGLAVRILGRPAVARRAAVRRVHVCRVVPGIVEASVVVHDGSHLRAAAVRLEAHRGRWRATALEIG